MARIVCQVTIRNNRVTVVWSERTSDQSFAPYTLDADAVQRMLHEAEEIRKLLAKAGPEAFKQLAPFAEHGRKWFQELFPEGDAEAQAAKNWLQATTAVESFEVIAGGTLPWAFVHDGDFWGLKYPLTASSRANPLRTAILEENPVVWNVGTQAKGDAAATFTAAAQLEAAFENDSPDILGLVLSSENDRPLAGIVGRFAVLEDILILVQFGSGSVGDGWRILFTSLPAVIVFPDAMADAQTAMAELVALLEQHQSVGSALQMLRKKDPIWLAVEARCPSHLKFPAPGEEPAETPPQYELPDNPYRPLEPYDSEDRALLAGRDGDIRNFCGLLDRSPASLTVVHGPGGVGKSSFLRGGVIPFLEDEAVGFRLLTDRTEPNEGPVIAIRPGRDLLGQLAQALIAFCATPFEYESPDGQKHNILLHSRLRQVLSPFFHSTAVASGSTITPEPPELNANHLWKVFRTHPHSMGEALETITRELPFELVLLIEQGEELLTECDAEGQRAASIALRSVDASTARCKLIVSVRTDFLGRLQDLLARHGGEASTYLLGPLSDLDLTEALLLPTAKEPLPLSNAIPLHKYGFSYEKGTPDALIKMIRAEAIRTGQSETALLQVAGHRLWEHCQRTKKNAIRQHDLNILRKGEQLLRQTVDERFQKLPLRNSEKKWLQALTKELVEHQPGGGLVRRAADADAILSRWPFRSDLEKSLQTVEEAKLIEVNQWIVDGEERYFVSLPQDAMLRVAQDYQEDKQRQKVGRSKMIDTLWITLPLIAFVAALVYFLTRRYYGLELNAMEAQAKQVQQLTQPYLAAFQQSGWPAYVGNLAQASQAYEAGNMLKMRQLLLRHQEKFGQDVNEQPDFRGFEWNYLWRLANGEIRSFLGHQSAAVAVAVSPDGNLGASAGADGTLLVWDLAGGLEKAQLKGHEGGIQALAFSPDSKLLAAAGGDNNVRLWKVDDIKDNILQPDKTLQGHTDGILALVYQKGILATAGLDKTVIVWDVEKATPKHTLKDHAEQIASLAITTDGKQLASAGRDKIIYLWDPALGKNLKKIDGDAFPLSLAYSNDGKKLFVGGGQSHLGGDRGVVQSWDVEGGKLATQAPLGRGVFTVAVAPDGKTVAAVGMDFNIHLLEADELREAGTIRGHHGWVAAVAYNPKSSEILSGSYDSTVRLWNPQPMEASHVLMQGKTPLLSIAFAPDQPVLAVGKEDGTVALLDFTTGKVAETIKDLGGPVKAVAFSKPGKPTLLAVGVHAAKGPGEISLFEVTREDKKVVLKKGKTLKDAHQAVNALAFAPRESLLVSVGDDRTGMGWDLEKGEKLFTMEGHPAGVESVAFSPDGVLLLTGDRQGNAIIWLAKTGQRGSARIAAHTAPLSGIAVLPSFGAGKEAVNYPIVSVGGDHIFKLWAVEGGEPQSLANHRGHQDVISCLAVGDRGRTIVTGSWDSTVKLWDVLRGERFTLPGRSGPVAAVAMHPSQTAIAAASLNGTLRVWFAGTEK